MKSVLYIEDEDFFGGIISQKLSEKGFDMVLATTGEKGLEFIENQDFSLILLDLFLPGMNGFQFMEKLKNDPKNKDIPVIVLSNLDTKEDHERAGKLGVKKFLVKMVTSPKDVIESAEEILSKS